MIRFPLLRKKNDVDINNTTMNKKSIPVIHECNTDLSDDTTVISYGSDDTDSLTSSSDHSIRSSDALHIQTEPIVGNAADPKKKNVRFHVTTKNNDGKQKQLNKKRELISFDDKKLSSKTWYSVNDIKKFKKYQKDYARYLITIHPNDMDAMINAFDESCPEQNQKLICLRGMEKFIQRPSADNCNETTTIISSSSTRRKLLYEAVLSVQIQKQQQQVQIHAANDNNENSTCCCNDLLINYYNVLIRTACIPITIPSIQYAYDIAQKDSYIAINHQVTNLVVL